MRKAAPVTPHGGGFRTVQETIRRRILSGVWRTGDRLPTLTEAARLFRVNANTVQRAIGELQKTGFVESRGRHGSFVSDRWGTLPAAPDRQRTGDRTLAGVQAGIFVHWRLASPGFAAQSLVTLDRLLTSRFCLEGGALEHLFVEYGVVPSEAELRQLMAGKNCQALIVAGGFVQNHADDVRALQRLRIPLIGYSGTVGLEMGFDAVRIDDHWAFRQAVEYLTKLGHRRLAFVGLPLSDASWEPWTRVRLAAFQEELREQGLKCPASAVFGVERLAQVKSLPASVRPPEPLAVAQPGHGYAMGKRFPADRFSAVVCANDNVAVAFIAALRERGIRVPEDVSVMGYDNVPMETVQKELTTFALPDQRIADAVASLILRRVAGDGDLGDQVNVLVRPILVPRKTCQSVRESETVNA